MDELSLMSKYFNILIVEDDDNTREILKLSLNPLFKTTYTASNGKEALEIINQNTIDIVLTDINMPIMNGIELIKKIKKSLDIPILVLTAHNECENLEKLIKLRIDRFLLKPLDIEQLIKVLKKPIKKLYLQREQNNLLYKLNQYQETLNENLIVSKTDLKGIITFVNKKFEEVSGYSKEELLHKPHNIVRHPDTPKEVFKKMWETIQSGKIWSGKLKNKSKDGSAYYVDATIKPIFNIDGEIVEYFAIRQDISQNINIKKRIRDIVSLMKNPIVSIIKINNFVDIERIYGVDVAERISDEFLEILKNKIKKYCNPEKFFTITYGKYVLIKEYNGENVNNLEKFVEEMAKLYIKIEDNVMYDISIKLSVSIGENAYEDAKVGIDILEENNKNFIIAINKFKEEKEKSKENLKILKKVHYALENNEICSLFQPIVDIEGNVVKYESLVRLKDNDKLISPFFFLELSKKVGYYHSITKEVIKNSFNTLKRLNQSISINLSIVDILNKDIKNYIFEMLDKHQNIANKITFELLEEENDINLTIIRDFIDKIKEYGVTIAIDDFGSGYSNYKRIFTYKPDLLKIDGSLVKEIQTDKYSYSIVKSITSFAKENNLKTVAEFVENKEIFDILKGLNVDYFQGYYFGKPEML